MTREHASQPITSKVEDRVLVLERIFDAPRELVFQAFADAEHLKRWWGPQGWTLPVCRIDFRPGGVWHFSMLSPDGQMESWGKAVYREIIAPDRIVYVDSFSDAEGNIVEAMPSTLITMEFVEQEGGTKLVNRAEYASAEDLKAVMDMGLLQGISETWDRLATLLQQLQAGGRDAG